MLAILTVVIKLLISYHNFWIEDFGVRSRHHNLHTDCCRRFFS